VGAEPGEACGARREMIAIACALSNLALSARELRYQLSTTAETMPNPLDVPD
jgi:hypothetical protein